MRKAFLALLLLVGAVAMASVAFGAVSTQRHPMQPADPIDFGSGLRAPGTSSVLATDTVWVGLSTSNHYNALTNPNNIYVGTLAAGVSGANRVAWDFDTFGFADGGVADSLQGWTPLYHNVDYTTSLLPNSAGDINHPWLAVDEGNLANVWHKGPYAKNRGVVGVWHADPGINAGVGVTWTPINGTKSAWCGLRAHGDNSVVDQVTGNPFNSNCLDWQITDWLGGGTAVDWPGYSRNWEQMLYRDFTDVSGQPLTLSFTYRTRMSALFASRRVGWFHGDPLNNVTGNFYEAFPNAVVDSFQVYIGVPVNDAAVLLSDGSRPAVYDPQRRWFDEVIQIWEAPYYEVMSAAGCNPPVADTTGHMSFSTTISDAVLQTIATSVHNPSPGTVRLVFRIKTNNTGDDTNGDNEVTGGGRGAAQLDDVTLQFGAGSPTVIGDFEGAEQSGPNSIDNRVSATALTNWKSTGRPVPIWAHARPLAGLPWADLCGLVQGPGRICNMQGNVMDFGADGYNESIGINTVTAFQDNYYDAISPSIDLTTASSPNPMGLTADRVNPTEDYHLNYDLYPACIVPNNSGVYWWYGSSCYPAQEANGTATWSPEILFGNAIWYTTQLTCRRTLTNGYRANGCIYTSNATGVPDSIRVFIGLYNYPEDNGATIGANPTSGFYFDNVAFGFVNKTAGSTLGGLTTNIYDYWCDAFPTASYTLPSGVFSTIAELDTCGATIKGAINIAQGSAAATLPTKNDILADSIDVTAGDASKATPSDTNSTNVRVDLVFRILPGPGNYRQTVADSVPRVPTIAGMNLLRRPDDRSTLVNPGDLTDHSFWASYIRTPGAFASPGAHHGGTRWDELSWNSARMDTTHSNLWPGTVNKTNYQTTYHPDDPHLGELGISRPRCFVADTSNTARNSNNIVCNASDAAAIGGGVTYPPAWITTVPQSRTGWDGTTSSIRGTKIIPDGLLTPGSHVEYFFRKSQIFGYSNQAPNYFLNPDTTSISITVANAEQNADGHRWIEFGVLPDRYKASEYKGKGEACMLVADYERRRGDAIVWASVMDSIGGTTSERWGANNGWHAPGGGFSLAATNPSLSTTFVVNKNAGAGTLWDLYRASTEGLFGNGNRLGGRFALPGAGRLLGQDATISPTPYMLKSYYRNITILMADLKTTDLGPALDIPEDDIDLLQNFLTATDGVGGTSNLPRSLYLYGQGIVQSEAGPSAVVGPPSHPAFMNGLVGVAWAANSYSALASNKGACSDLSTTTAISATADVYGVGITCSYSQNVIAAATGGQVVSYYQDLGHGPYPASVWHQATPSANYITMTDAFRLTQQWGRYCATSAGRLARTYSVMTHIFATACNKWVAPTGVTGVPNTPAGFANYMKIGNSVMRSGNANVRFGVANTGRVRVRLYDVTGRLVRTLADKTYQGGQEYSVIWDGRSDAGSQVARGVYFARIDYASGTAINGRVVVLQ